MLVEKNDNIVQQLNKIYYEEEWWHNKRLSELEASRYHSAMLHHGRLKVILEEEKVIGYVESWLISYEQFGKLICNAPFSPLEEDVVSGNIAYLANIWVRKDRRRGFVIKQLVEAFKDMNKDAEFFVGEAKRKKTQPVKVFNRKEFYDKLKCKGV